MQGLLPKIQTSNPSDEHDRTVTSIDIASLLNELEGKNSKKEQSVTQDSLSVPVENKNKGWDFTPNQHQAFVVKLVTSDWSEWNRNTAVIFSNTNQAGAERWENISGYSRIFDPLAIMSLFHLYWNTRFKNELNGEIGFLDSPEKISSLDHLLTSETPFTFDGGPVKTRAAFPMKIWRPTIHHNNDVIEFSVGFYSGNVCGNPVFQFRKNEIARSFIESQFNVRHDYLIDGVPTQIQPYMKVRTWLKESIKPLSCGFETLSLRALFEHNHYKIPSIYAQLWSSIVNDIHTPDILRLNLLIQFYDKVIHAYVSADEHNEIENILSSAREILTRKDHYAYPVLPDPPCEAMISSVEPKGYADHALQEAKLGPSTLNLVVNVGMNALDRVASRKNTRNYIEDLYQLLIKDQYNALHVYQILKSLFYVIYANMDDDPVENTYLNNYVKDIEAALTHYEKNIEQARKSLSKDQKYEESSENCTISRKACKDLELLEHSPFAWEQVINHYKCYIASKNFSLGFGIQHKRGFEVVGVFKHPTEKNYVLRYLLPNKKEEFFTIKASEKLDQFLRQETKNSFAMPLARRIELVYKNDTEFNNQKRIMLKNLFLPEHDSLWGTKSRVAALRDQLNERIHKNDFLLTMREKIDLIVYAVITMAVSDESLIGSAAEIFKLITDPMLDSFLLTPEALMLALTQFNLDHIPPETCFRHKALLCYTLNDINALKTNPKIFISQVELDAIMNETEPKDGYESIEIDKSLRLKQKKFISNFLHDEYSRYSDEENLLDLYTIYFCLNVWHEPPDSTLDLLHKIAAELLKKSTKEQENYWAVGTLFQGLAKSHLFRRKDLSQGHQALALITLAHQLITENKIILTGENLFRLMQLLSDLEHASLITDIIPEFLGELEIDPVLPIKTVAVNKKKKPKARQVSMITHQGTQTNPLPEFPPQSSGILSSSYQIVASVTDTIIKTASSMVNMPESIKVLQGVTEPMPNYNSSSTSPTIHQPVPPASFKETNELAYDRLIANTKQSPILDEFSDASLKCTAATSDLNEVLYGFDLPVMQLNTNNDSFKKLPLEIQNQQIERDNEKKNLLQKLSEKNRNLFDQRYKNLQDSLNKFNTLRQEAMNELSALNMKLSGDFTPLELRYKEIKQAGHKEEFTQLKDVSELIAKVESHSFLPVTEYKRKLDQIAKQLAINVSMVHEQITTAKSDRDANKKAAEALTQKHMLQSTPGMIRQLKDFESKLIAESLNFSPKIAARILAFQPDDLQNDQSHLTGKCLQYAKLLKASADLRVMLSLTDKSKFSEKPSPLLSQYQELQTELSGLQIQYDTLSFFTSPLKKFRLMVDIHQQKMKISTFEKIIPATGAKAEYEKLSWFKPWEFLRKKQILKHWNDPIFMAGSQDQDVSIKTDQSVKDDYHRLLLDIPYNQKVNTPATKQLLWSAEKIREKQIRDLHDNSSQKPLSEVFEDCQSKIHEFREASKFKNGLLPVPMETFFNKYDASRQFVDPVIDTELSCLETLFKDIPSLESLPSVKNTHTQQYSSNNKYRGAIYDDNNQNVQSKAYQPFTIN